VSPLPPSLPSALLKRERRGEGEKKRPE